MAKPNDSSVSAETEQKPTAAPGLYYFRVMKKNIEGHLEDTGLIESCDEKWLDVYQSRNDLIQISKP